MSDSSPSLRPEISAAWHRARLSGLEPGSDVQQADVSEVDLGSRLVTAAKPVLDAVAEQLKDTRFSVLLADRDARVVERRFGELGLADALDGVNAVPGCQYCEDTTGTNALATAFELRRGIAVTGTEHFLEPLKRFCCYGHPVVNPLTGCLEGVLDVTGYAEDATSLLAPFVTQAARDIEQRLLAGSRLRDQRLLAAYRAHTARTNRPVMVLGDGVTLANRAASELLDLPSARTRFAAAQGQPSRQHVYTRDGGQAVVRVSTLPETGGAVLVEADSATLERRVIPRGEQASIAPPAVLAERRRTRTRVLIHGEPGSGRTWTARKLAGEHPLELVDAAVLTAEAVPDLLEHRSRLVVIDGIHLLDQPTAASLAHALDSSAAWVALTSGPSSELVGEQRGLAARCPAQVETTPLRYRRRDIPALAHAVLRGNAVRARLTPGALEALSAHTWPGNMAELATVLEETARTVRHGAITEFDLPFRPRHQRTISPLEQAEFDTITAALQRTHGNKAQTATHLGIGRTTLYRRLRALGID